ncbi:hypothetical protein AU193_18100 [Mycobacterium sp. GA-1285]|nr:hypothetical protein AU193_18100 [Mycobacterium sp. GA-1285]
MVALALALWVVAVAAGWTLPANDIAPAHGPHALSSALGHEQSVVVEHSHISDAPIPLPPDAIAEGVLPRTSNSLLALALIGTLTAVLVRWRQPELAAIRGPPRQRSAVLSGRVRLTRLCIARR